MAMLNPGAEILATCTDFGKTMVAVKMIGDVPEDPADIPAVAKSLLGCSGDYVLDGTEARRGRGRPDSSDYRSERNGATD